MTDFDVISIDVHNLTDEEVLKVAVNSSNLVLQRLARIADNALSDAAGAYNEGYDDGQRYGFQEGYDEGYKDAELHLYDK